jgi:hypothetical protein
MSVMEESEVIHSQRKHEVSMPEGSHVAVSKTATPQEPSVRKVFRNEAGEGSEPIAEDRFANDQDHAGLDRMANSMDTGLEDRTDLAKNPLESTNTIIGSDLDPTSQDHKPPPAIVISPAPTDVTSPLGALAPAQVSDSGVDALHGQADVANLSMPQMDFPARVVRLRIENEKLRTRLENMESET